MDGKLAYDDRGSRRSTGLAATLIAPPLSATSWQVPYALLPAQQLTVMSLADDDWDYRVRHRAYELWNEAGRPDGKHLLFWEAAERELKRIASDAEQTGPSAAAPGKLAAE